MKLHPVKVHPSKALLKREDQLAWKMAGVAVDKVAVEKPVQEMIINRIIDNASVAIAAINRRPVVSARGMALGHAKKAGGAQVFGVKSATTVSPEWAAWANGTAVRELDMHDTFLAADYSHPGDNIPPVLAVAQAMGKSGRDLIRGLATGYELHIDLVRAICLHEHKVDHIAHLCPAAAAGIGTLRPEAGSGLSIHPAGFAYVGVFPPIAQGRDFILEGLCPRPCRQAGGGSRGSLHAR